MRRFRFAIIFLALVTIGCRSQSDRAPAIGVAYAGPATLALREEINPRSAAVGTAHHGERLELIQQRRRFFKVRNAKGEEGWTDERLLLTTEEVERLQHFNQQARTMPSQGSATTYQALFFRSLQLEGVFPDTGTVGAVILRHTDAEWAADLSDLPAACKAACASSS